MTPRVPNPGSHDAIRRGCKCSPIANRMGAGVAESSRHNPDFDVYAACELHGAASGWVYEAPAVTLRERAALRGVVALPKRVGPVKLCMRGGCKHTVVWPRRLCADCRATMVEEKAARDAAAKARKRERSRKAAA